MKYGIKCLENNRASILGVAAIGVILVHSNGIMNSPETVKWLFGFGGVGVYMFVFLSAIGLYRSLKKRGTYSKKDFYIRRFKRVGIPYLLIAGIWYFIDDLCIEQSLWRFFYDLSTISFWTEHKGAWYVAMLIPLYAIYPFLYDWVEKKKSVLKLSILIIAAVIAGFVLSIASPAMFNHLGQVVNSIIVFLIGYLYVKLCDDNKDYIVQVSVICIVLFLIKSATPLKNIDFVSGLTWSLLGLPFTYVSAVVFELTKRTWLPILLGKVGGGITRNVPLQHISVFSV